MCLSHVLQDPDNLDAYIRNNIFLPDINNEKEDKSPQYADNLASLQRLVLFRFDEDTTGALIRIQGGRQERGGGAGEYSWAWLAGYSKFLLELLPDCEGALQV
jgi:hypothetical protein